VDVLNVTKYRLLKFVNSVKIGFSFTVYLNTVVQEKNARKCTFYAGVDRSLNT